jgi:hypothetical protein
MASTSAADAAAVQSVRDAYMEEFSAMFEAELLEIYEADTTGEAVMHLRSCIEAGVAVWGHPLVLPDPTK